MTTCVVEIEMARLTDFFHGISAEEHVTRLREPRQKTCQATCADVKKASTVHLCIFGNLSSHTSMSDFLQVLPFRAREPPCTKNFTHAEYPVPFYRVIVRSRRHPN